MVKFDLIQTFLTIVETNSFHAAAKKLNKSTASISQKINSLEIQLHVELIKRDTRNIEITPIGLAYYEQCKRIFNEIELADKLIKTQHDEPRGKLKIACPISILIPQIAKFREIYPEIELIIDCNENWPNVEKDKIDIIVGMTLEAPQDFVRKMIGGVRYTLCGSSNYFKANGVPSNVHELIQHRYIGHIMRVNDKQLSFKNELVVPVNPWIWLNSTQAMLNCALNDLGIALLHNFVTASFIKNGDLIEIFADLQTQTPLCVYYPYHQYLDPKVRLFLNYLDSINLNF